MKPETVALKSLTDRCAEYITALHVKHGDAALYTFASIDAAKEWIQNSKLVDWVPYGLQNSHGTWYQIRPAAVVYAPPARAKPRARSNAAPTAKALCLAAFTRDIERNAFVDIVMKQGVKESTARTMYSDVKAGRVK